MMIEISSRLDESLLLFRSKNGTYCYSNGLQSSDVPPGPVKLSGVREEWGSGKWFMFWIVDSMSPPCYVVQHESFESAYEEFVDWQVDQLKIEGYDLKDYKDGGGDLECSYTSNGVPVDTESVHGEEVELIAALNNFDDKTLWNLACMFLAQVTRYDNKYDDTNQFLQKMASCVGGDVAKAVASFKMAESVSHHTF